MFCLFPDLAGNMAGGVKEEIINNWWLHYTARYDLVRDKTRGINQKQFDNSLVKNIRIKIIDN